MQATVTLSELLATSGITLAANLIGPDTDENGWEHDSWTLTLGYNGRTLRTPFKMGKGHRREIARTLHGTPVLCPTAPDLGTVMGSMLMTASTTDGALFEDWCADLGYDSDSRKAERMYFACQKETAALRKLLGAEYENFRDAENDL